MQGHGERMVEDQCGLVLHLGMSLAWAPGQLCIHSKSKARAKREERPFISRQIRFKYQEESR